MDLINKKVVLIGQANVAKITEYLKSLGINTSINVNNKMDVAVYNPFIVWPNEKYRSALAQVKNNGKELWPTSKLIKKLEAAGYDIPSYLRNADIIFETDKKRVINDLVNANMKAFNDDIFMFNDDTYEIETNKCNGCFRFDKNVLEKLHDFYIDVDSMYEYEGKPINLQSIIKIAGGYSCLKNIMALCFAAKYCMGAKMDVKLRVYRDKWEYRGDYGGMFPDDEILPAIFWVFNEDHPYGYCTYSE